MEDAIARAQELSPASMQASTLKETSYWQYRNFKTNYHPIIRLVGNVPTYRQSFISVQQPDGSIVYQSVNQVNPGVSLQLEQPVYWSGGKISVNTSLYYFNNRSSNLSQWNGEVMNIRLSQPLFGFNRYKWERRIQPLLYEESKKAYIENKEYISSQVVGGFFDVLIWQVNKEIASFNLANTDTIFIIEQERLRYGTTSQDKLLQIRMQLLKARQDLATAEVELKTSKLYLRSLIMVKDDDDFSLLVPSLIPDFNVSTEEALSYAKRNRGDYVSFERRRVEAERDIAEVKVSRFSASVEATYGLNKASTIISGVYETPQKQQTINIGFSIPIVDWGRNHASLKAAYANKKLNDYVTIQDEINFTQTITTKVLQLDLLRLQVNIAKEADELAKERYNFAYSRYLEGRLDIANLTIALSDKDNAARGYIMALKSFWLAVYEIRRLTLYDFNKNELLYKTE